MLKNTGKLAGQTIFITGASRGIGKALALKAAQDGANIVIAAKTAQPHPKLPGTIYTAAKEIEDAGGKALPCVVDVRDENQVTSAVENAVKKFGGIDILINNASAVSLTSTLDTDMKRYDLMQSINTRGTFLVSKTCIPFLKKSKNPHILNMSPPLNMKPLWFSSHCAYTIAKYGMSMCVLGMAAEFKEDGIAVNALWPRTAIDTAAMSMLAGRDAGSRFRKPDIVADAAYAILTKESRSITGQFLIDDEVLKAEGITDFTQYAVDPANANNLFPDAFVDGLEENAFAKLRDAAASAQSGNIAKLFSVIQANLSESLVSKTNAVFLFNVKGGSEEGPWFIDLKNGSGSSGRGKPSVNPDVTLEMESKLFFEMFSGKLKPASAFMTGKLKIKGDLTKALKLEKLMGNLKSKV
ncbi:Dehydrogenase/reductase SDR family protein 7-like [Gryllus bimaculatus]|nr:Dehydrogenase/reductase SDR family protein 7-like [Gryllus bimaculatus]